MREGLLLQILGCFAVCEPFVQNGIGFRQRTWSETEFPLNHPNFTLPN